VNICGIAAMIKLVGEKTLGKVKFKRKWRRLFSSSNSEETRVKISV
jgi:hypothetical protein